MTSPQDMFDLALAAQAKAYAPYSDYPVGAAIRAASGALYAGCNVENAAYPQGWCAEASAIAAMVMAGETSIAEVLVMGDGPEPCTPCGGCRQKLFEFAGPEVVVHVCNSRQKLFSTTVGELLPNAFGPGNLGVRPKMS